MKLKLRYKILLALLGILTIAMVATLGYFTNFYKKEVQENLHISQEIALDTYDKVSKLQLSRLRAVTQSILLSPRFRQSISVGIHDKATLQDSIFTEFEVSGSDLLIVCNDEGKPLEGLISGKKGFLNWGAEQSGQIQKSSLIQVHVSDDFVEKNKLKLNADETFADYMVFQDSLFSLVSSPIYDVQDNYLGVLLLGIQVSPPLVAELKRVTKADISFFNEDKLFATSLGFTKAKEMLGRLPQGTTFEVDDHLATRSPLKNAKGKPVADLLVMRSLQTFHNRLTNLYTIALGLFIAVLVLAAFVSILLSGMIVKPLHTLAAAFEKVGEGDLTVQTEISSGDEIQELSLTFNEMVSGLRQKETMSKFLTGMELKEVEAVSGGSKELAAAGDKRMVTILFSDIRSFTSICEDSDPGIIIDALNTYFDALIPMIEENGGSLDKLIGDCIMAVFEHSDEVNGAEAAIRTSISMQSRLESLRPEMVKAGMPEFHAGFGINTGESVVGNVGTSNQLSRTVLGDAVNLAARVEALSKEGKETKILFTEQTLEKLHFELRYHFLMENTVKGKTKPVSIYEVAGEELKLG